MVAKLLNFLKLSAQRLNGSITTVLGVPFFVYSSLKEIQFVQDNFIKYAFYLPKQCSNYISRNEVSKLPLKLKIWSQMVKYLYNLNREPTTKF